MYIDKLVRDKKTGKIALITEGAEWINGRLSNHWSGFFVEKNGVVSNRPYSGYGGNDFEEVILDGDGLDVHYKVLKVVIMDLDILKHLS